MLQRVQSIWLLLAAVCAFISLKATFYIGTNAELIPSYELKGTENVFTIALTVAVGIIALVAIFLYSNRSLQIKLCVLGILLEAALIGLYYYYIRSFSGGTYAITALLHGAIVLFFFMAARGISRDNKIIRESNRLR